MMISLPKKHLSIEKLFKPNALGISEWITRETIDADQVLNWGNNGVSRGGILYKYDKYIWKFGRLNNKPTGKIIKIRLNGINHEKANSQKRPVRADIHAHHKKMGCVACGTSSYLVTDHKNDLYNDPRVLNSKTQIIEDFQCLCNHCNLQKRQVSKKTLELGKRYSATNIPMLSIFGVDFTEGDETYNKNDINAMVGTYWHDPVSFMSYLKSH
jgi:hypothetical protein